MKERVGRLSSSEKKEMFLIHIKNIPIPVHGNCQPSTPRDVKVEPMGNTMYGSAKCGDKCDQEFVTFPLRDTWYERSKSP